METFRSLALDFYLSCLKDLALLLALLLLPVLELIALVAMQWEYKHFLNLNHKRSIDYFISQNSSSLKKHVRQFGVYVSKKQCKTMMGKQKKTTAFKQLDFRAAVSACTFSEGMTPASVMNSSVGRSSRRQQPQSLYLLLVRCLEAGKAITSDESISSLLRLPSTSPGQVW